MSHGFRNLNSWKYWTLIAALSMGCGDGGGAPSARDGGQDEPVVEKPTIVRDSRGVPHVYGETLADGFYALGYAQAEDRLFQMHYRRSVMQGRLAEYFAVQPGASDAEAFNDKLIDSDTRARVLGYARRAETSLLAMSAEQQELLAAYAEGVNAYVATLSGDLPHAFALARITSIDPWKATDSILAWDWVGWHFDGVRQHMQAEIDNLNDCESPNGCDPVPCEFPIDEDAAVVPAPLNGVWPPRNLLAKQPQGQRRHPVNVKASHGWVVHGSKTTTGKPALYGEPQLVLEAPSTWHEFHMDAGEVNARGVGIAGAPGVFIFHNEFISQTVTAGGADTADLFELTLNAAGDKYVVDGQEFSIGERDETLEVRHGQAVTITVRETRFGPVVNDILNNVPEGRTFAGEISSHLPGNPPSVAAGIELMRAKSLTSYRDALRLWRSPTLNMLYAGVDEGAPADSTGHIAYHTGTAIPRRTAIMIDDREFTGRYPIDASVGGNFWGELYDLDWHPHAIDPEKGYLFSGNHLPIGSWYDMILYSGIGGVGDTYRSLRVRYALAELLPTADSKASPDQLHAIHFDAKSEIARGIHDMLKSLQARGAIGDAGDLSSPASTREEKAARIILALDAWQSRGGELSYADLAWPLVARITANSGIKARFQQNLAFACEFNGAEGGASFAVKTFDKEGADMISAPVLEWLLAVADASWDEAVPTQGSENPSNWTLPSAETKTVTYQKNFGCLRPGQPKTCSLDTGFETELTLEDAFINTINSAFGSSYPLSVSFGAADDAKAFLPPGVSEDPDSPHFDDGLAFTVQKAAGDVTNMPHASIDRATIAADAQSTLELER